MKLLEHEAKAVFAKAGIPIPKGVIVADAGSAAAAAVQTGFPCVLKAQVYRGGRGKAGLIRLVKSADDARDTAASILAAAPDARGILVEEAVDIAREVYLSVTVDARAGCGLVLGCAEGGIDIETLASTAPGKIVRETVDLDRGLSPFQARSVAYALGLEGDVAKRAAAVLDGLWRVFRSHDAEVAEINPLFVTNSGSVVAGDGKLSVDDNSLFRHPGMEPGRGYYDSDAAYAAAIEGIPYLQFDGDISLMCAGAGLTTTVYDLIADEGGSVANFLEFGGPNYKKAVRAMELCLANKPRVILIVTFGTIARADVMAEGIAEAISRLKPACPIVACIRGTGEEKAVEILKAAGLAPLFDTEEAVGEAVALSKGGRR